MVTAEADEKKQLKKMFCFLHKKTKRSCIVMPNLLHFKNFLATDKEDECKTFWQATRVQNTLAKKETFQIGVKSRQCFLKKKKTTVKKLW